MNRNTVSTLSEAIEEINTKYYNHNQDLLLLSTINDPYISDEEVGDDRIGGRYWGS